MEVSCDLEVDVNGEGIFLVNKNIISSYSRRVNKLFGKSKGITKNLKLIFQDFPGGAESFELMTRFCYNKGKIEINPSNTPILYCVASFMEMNQSVSGTKNLVELTEKSLKEIKHWTWSEHMLALKQFQDLFPVSSSSGMIEKCLDSIIGRIESSCEPSSCPSTSSPGSSRFRLSFDTKSTESFKNSFYRATWWFEDFVALKPFVIKMLVKLMVSRSFDHGVISRFLFYYQKGRFIIATPEEKCKIIEDVIEMLCSLNQSILSCKNLFQMLRVSSKLKLSKCCRNKLESMIGSVLDQATLDNLLVPSPVGIKYLYDVNLVLRFLKSFHGKGAFHLPLSRLKRMASLMDLYLAEVAPDPCLKTSKFVALITALPDSARDSYDGIYRAMDMYLEVHLGLCEEERFRVCSGLNFEKLSSEICDELAQNTKFPVQSAKQALVSQQHRLRSLLQGSNQIKASVDNSPFSFPERECDGKKVNSSSEQIVLYAGKLDLPSEHKNLKAHLQGMQCRVLELEKVCRSMQIQMTKVMKARVSSHNKAKSLPRLCS